MNGKPGLLLGVSFAACLNVLAPLSFASEPVVFEADSAAAHYFDGAEQRTCSGRIAALYLNRPNPDGSYQGYRDAAVANAAWLSAKGYEDVELSTFVARDQADALAFGNLIVYPDAERYRETRRNRPSDRDQAFEDFVTEYGRNTGGSIRLLLCLETLTPVD